jgi:type IV fimbrial biogenesis protein FimT
MPVQRFGAIATYPRAQLGFGFVELMTTVVIMAILGAIALPSFNKVIRDNRVGTEANDFLTAIKYARNESITRSRGVTLCAADTVASGSAPPTACGGVGDWSKGWMVFVDDTVTGTPPTAIDPALVLRTWLGNTHNSVVPDAAQTYVRFSPRGGSKSNTLGDVVFTLKPLTGCTEQQQRQVLVTELGRSSSSKVDCT